MKLWKTINTILLDTYYIAKCKISSRFDIQIHVYNDVYKCKTAKSFRSFTFKNGENENKHMFLNFEVIVVDCQIFWPSFVKFLGVLTQQISSLIYRRYYVYYKSACVCHLKKPTDVFLWRTDISQKHKTKDL